MSYLEPLMRQNFLEYASYVIMDRAIPDLRDGCKPVQRRLLTTLHDIEDGRFHKVANVIGETMKLHPHGDASIGDALVVLANKEYFIERQGNFGNILTGHSAAAPRYIECRLTPLARDTLFNKKLTDYQPSYDGRKDEPVYLPAKLPVILMLGTEGIAVGMSTRILPHNFCELLRAQIDILRHKPVALFPDFPQGGLMDAAEYEDGKGRVRVRGRVEIKDEKTLVIREIPYSTTTEGLIQSIEAAVAKQKLKVARVEDRTAEDVEIVVHLPRGVYAEEVKPQLYAYTQCEVSISSNLVVIRDEQPAEPTVTEILKELTEYLREQIRAEIELELLELEDKQHFLTLEQIFIENRVYKKIETAKTSEAVRTAVYRGMEPYTEFFIRAMVDDDVERLLQIRIRRISLYDIDKYRKELDDIVRAIRAGEKKLGQLTKTTIAYLDGLIKKYGDAYPRRTRIVGFEQVLKHEVALQNVKLSFDPETGFFGSAIKAGSRHKMTVSEYDKILIVFQNGTYRFVDPPEKLFVGKRVLAVEAFNKDEGIVLTYLYRDTDKCSWAKKIHITGFIKDKEYELIKGKAGKVDKLWVGGVEKLIQMLFVPMKRQRKREEWFHLENLDFCGLQARGTRLSTRAVEKVKIHKG
jgi:topoisomerase-4 subunit A